MEIEPLLPDPITHLYRKSGYQRELQRINFISKKRPGFNLRYWKRIVRVPEKLDTIGKHRQWSNEQIMLVKALLTSRMGALYIDHIIRRLREIELVSSEREHREWERQYNLFVKRYVNDPQIKDRCAIVKEIRKLHRYTNPPQSLLRKRAKHWKSIEKFLSSESRIEEVLRYEIDKILDSPLSNNVKAFKIAFTVALYADVGERVNRMVWTFAYRDTMLRLYDKIRSYPNVFYAIIEQD